MVKSTKERIAYHLSTVLGLGDKLPAPGTTAGSLPAIIGWWMAVSYLPTASARLAATLVGSVVVFGVGIWASQTESARRGTDDPGPVVIDEVAGQWLTMVPALLLIDPQTPLNLGIAAIVGFFLFRFFDVAKPWPVKRFEALHGGVGIMADDVAAACYAAILLGLALLLI